VTRKIVVPISLAVLGLFSLCGNVSGMGRTKPAGDTEREARIAYLKKHAIPVRSIAAEDVDFADLEPLRRVIGGRRVVMLGESSHGDGATFAAKVRLIKFLHRHMGFDVLAFESGFYDVHKAWSALRAGEDPQKAVSSAVPATWSASLQSLPLWNYVAAQSKTDHPLELSGFDMQFTGSASPDHLQKDLGGYLAKAGLTPSAAADASRVMAALATVLEDPSFIRNGSEFKKIQPAGQDAILNAFHALGEALASLPPCGATGMIERDFWIQFLRSSAALLKMSWRVNMESIEQSVLDWAFNLRDQQMGENLVWLAKRAYPNRKIVVWSAASHISRHHELLGNQDAPLVPMGDWLDEAMGSEVYSLGFASYRGRWAEIEMPVSNEVVPAPPGSLEGLFFSAGFDFAVIDFRNPPADGAWLRGPLSCRFLKYKPMTADWTRIFDGMFFIKEMFPCTRIEENFLKDE
jgi:erythromycin esterase